MKKDLQALLLPWETPQQLPIVFQYGEQTVHGIPEAWNPEATVQKLEKSTETTVVGTSPEGVELKVVCKRYEDYAAAEFVGYLTNRGSQDSPMVQSIRFAYRPRGGRSV